MCRKYERAALIQNCHSKLLPVLLGIVVCILTAFILRVLFQPLENWHEHLEQQTVETDGGSADANSK